jgi:hypothetical protein
LAVHLTLALLAAEFLRTVISPSATALDGIGLSFGPVYFGRLKFTDLE